AQAELVAALVERHRNVTVVGDDDQAIYAFRGAAIDNIIDFRDRYVGARTVVLRRNYRSLSPVLDAAYRLIRFNDPDRLEVRTAIVKRLRAQRSAAAAAPVRLEVFATGSEEADWIASEIDRRIQSGAAPRDHAVLVRANGHADPILRALNMAGIPWRFSGTSGLYARPEVRLLLAFLRVVADLGSSVDLYALAASEVYGLGAELDPDADAVAGLTVHKAKGLEFPVVVLPGMVAGRCPSRGRADPLALPSGLGRGAPPAPEMALAEERRLAYVAMTRARDELVLSHAADYGGSRTRRVSPFVLEALDLPLAAGVPGAGARTSTPVERLAGFDASAVASPSVATAFAGGGIVSTSSRWTREQRPCWPARRRLRTSCHRRSTCLVRSG